MSGISGLYGGLDMTKVMFGQNAFHIPVNIISQDVGEGEKVAGVFQTSHGLPLRFNSQRTHVLALGDMMFRPRLVIASDHWRGMGISGLYKDGFISVEDWLANGDVIISPDNQELEAHAASLRRRRG